jgi:exopolysaccharide biosynthesis polyprenyl glycosylphosphotransferase
VSQLDGALEVQAGPAALTEPVPRAHSFDDLVDERTRRLISSRRYGSRRRRGWVMRRALAAADVSGILLAFVATQLAFAGNEAPVDRISPGVEILVFALSLPLWVVLGRLYGLYAGDEVRANHSTVDDFFGVFNMLTVGAWLFFGLAYVVDFASPSFPKLGLFWLLAVALVVAGRTIARGLVRRTDAFVQNTLVVGAGQVGQRVARKLLTHPEYGVNVVGFVDDNPRLREDGIGDLSVLGGTDRLPELVQALDIERVIVAFSQAADADTLDLVRGLGPMSVQVDIVPRLFDVLGPHMTVHAAEGLPLLGLAPARLSNSALFLKRVLDLTLSVVALVVLAPLFIVVAAAIKLDSRGPVLFRQERMGLGGRPFTINKFRTMSADADARKSEVVHLNKHLESDPRMFKVPNDPRVTRVGRFLRRYSIDELPQLLNVLGGEMSLVGPRPLIPEESRHVDGWGLRRLDLKPGITGLWQVLGRDDIPFGDMVHLDYQYVTSWTLSGDVKLILGTIPAVLRAATTTPP